MRHTALALLATLALLTAGCTDNSITDRVIQFETGIAHGQYTPAQIQHELDSIASRCIMREGSLTDTDTRTCNQIRKGL